MRDAGARGIEIDAVLACERFDLSVLLQILRRDILNVVIDCENRLRGIGDFRRADLLELGNHRSGVVVRHHVARANRNEIAGADDCARSEAIRVTRGNFFDQR